MHVNVFCCEGIASKTGLHLSILVRHLSTGCSQRVSITVPATVILLQLFIFNCVFAISAKEDLREY